MTDITKIVKNHIEKYNLNMTAEEMFVEFERLVSIYKDFSLFLKQNNLTYKLNKMKRNERLKEKRAIFFKWYQKTNPNQTKYTTDLWVELSEMTFVSDRTVQNDISRETIAKTSLNTSH